MTKEQKQLEMEQMRRVWNLISHPLYKEYLQKIQEEERDRRFCRHDFAHFLDVARLAYIFKLERGCQVSKELIYGAAVLHDIGKWQQYRKGVPHEIASSRLAEELLLDAGFLEEERKQIQTAIFHHRKGDGMGELDILLYEADKISRNCYTCPVKEACNWAEEQKNQKVTW